MAFLGLKNAAADEPKRVLLVHSFGSAAPPFTVESTAFETELVGKMGGRVDLDEVSLDMARYPDRDMQEAIVDYLQKRQAKWQPDLVVPIGSPAAIFVATYRDRLFPETPILYASADRRLLPPGALDKNAAYVGQIYEIPGFLEDMLKIAPATKNIVVIVGATPLERLWQGVFQKAAEPFAGRINFTYFSDLSFKQMQERVSTLPPDSYIFFLLLLRDAGGVTLNGDEALQRLHAVARAPINGIFDHQLGLGIVGGRLYQSERVGKAAAQIAIRILRGEPASSFPPTMIERLPPRYDWRELQRWKIDEKLLPTGSTVLFREPTVWDRYRAWIIAGISVFLLQALLITGLLVNLVRRRRAEISLGESEKRFQSMADAAPVLIWMSSEDKLCTFFNKAWLEFTGRSMEQELGKGWKEGVHPDDLAKISQTYGPAVDAREPFVMQYRLKNSDGEYRWITDQGVPRYGSHGNFRGYVGACVDITDLLKKETELREIGERVALAAEAAHVGVWELDTVTNELWISDKVRELFHFDRDAEITYAMFHARVHPEDRATPKAAIQGAIRTKGGYDTEFRLLLPDGTVRWISARARCVDYGDGKPARLLSVAIDVTKRKEAEELFRLVTEAAPSGILLANEEGRIVLVNAHFEELFGYKREELVGQMIEVLIPERFTAEYSALRAAFLARPEQRAMGSGRELLARRKDGTEFPAEIGLNSIRTPQGLLVLASVVDISQRKQAAEELRRHREQINLLSRVSLLGEMTTSLAHELYQPLSAIITNANAGMRSIDKGKEDPGTLREILVDVEADGRRAHDIIRNVRNTIKKSHPTLRRINLNELVTKVAHIVRPDAVAYSCQVKTSLAKDLPLIEGDPVQIQQVLVNLVSNALEAMRQTPPDRRKVEISTAGNGDNEVRLSVRDHGTGIRTEVHERLFDRFFTTKEQGLGMGLAIVRSIVESHGGDIQAENVADGGARFYFTLPVKKKT
jgi:PAS domain S-box-containing protein